MTEASGGDWARKAACKVATQMHMSENSSQDVDVIADALQAAEERGRGDLSFCICGCPIDQHDDDGEYGESCADENHECVRVCPAALVITNELRAKLTKAAADLETVRLQAAAVFAPLDGSPQAAEITQDHPWWSPVYQRAVEIRARLEKAEAKNAELQAEVERLEADVKTWRESDSLEVYQHARTKKALSSALTVIRALGLEITISGDLLATAGEVADPAAIAAFREIEPRLNSKS